MIIHKTLFDWAIAPARSLEFCVAALAPPLHVTLAINGLRLLTGLVLDPLLPQDPALGYAAVQTARHMALAAPADRPELTAALTRILA